MKHLRDFLIMLAIVLLAVIATTLYGNAQELTIYQTFPGTSVPDLSRPSAVINTQSGVVYETFQGTNLPRWNKPIGVAPQQRRSRIRRLPPIQMEDINRRGRIRW